MRCSLLVSSHKNQLATILHINYNEYMTKKTVVVASGIVAIGTLVASILAIVRQDSGDALTQGSLPKNERLGVWDWTAPDTISSSKKREIAAALKARGVTEVYIDITSYIDDDELPDASVRTAKTSAFTTALRETVRDLHSEGIAAHALAGGTHWADPDHAYIPLKLLAYVADYNKTAMSDEKLAGMQFDIEFYNDKGFKEAPLAYTQQFLDLTQSLVDERGKRFTDDPLFDLGFAISAAMDGSDTNYIPNINYNGTKQPPLSVLFHQLQGGNLPAYVAVMAYRNTAGATVERVQTEMEMAKKVPNIKVLIGEETTNVAPKSLTFYGRPLADLRQMTSSVQSTFADNPALGGYAINDQEGFLKLKD